MIDDAVTHYEPDPMEALPSLRPFWLIVACLAGAACWGALWLAWRAFA